MAPPASRARARVDIWHADAQGIYSGYEGQGDKQDLSTIGQKFLRGTHFIRIHQTISPGLRDAKVSSLWFALVRRTSLWHQGPQQDHSG